MASTSTTPTPGLVVAAGIAWPVIGAVAVGLRFFSRLRTSARIAVDDWLTVPALVLLCGQCACLIVGVYTKSLAYPTPAPPPGVDSMTYNSYESRVTRQLFWAVLLMQIPCLTLIKCSFVFLYRRFFVHRSQGGAFDVITWALVAVLVAWAIAFFLCELFLEGLDFESIWITKSLNKNTSRIDVNPWDISLTSTDFALDVIILVLPIRPIVRLKLSRSQKFSLLGVFALGGLAMAASVTRLAIFVGADNHYSEVTTDIDLFITTIAYWSVIESGLALIASCLPTMYGFLHIIRRNGRKGDSHTSNAHLSSSTKRSHSSSTWAGQSIKSGTWSSKDSVKGNREILLTHDVTVDIEEGPHLPPGSRWGETHIEANPEMASQR